VLVALIGQVKEHHKALSHCSCITEKRPILQHKCNRVGLTIMLF